MDQEDVARLVGQVMTVLNHVEERAEGVKLRQECAEAVLYDAARDVKQASSDIEPSVRTAIAERLKPVEILWKRLFMLFAAACFLVAIGLAWTFYYQYKIGKEIKDQYASLAHAKEFSDAVNAGVIAICGNNTLCVKVDKKAKYQGDYILIKK
jgi:hypothetical protein